jgi:transposase
LNAAQQAEAAANLYSLIASCKLHGLDPERYLAEMIRIMPYWPRDRFLGLAPAYWAQTRGLVRASTRSNSRGELGFVTVPPIADLAQQSLAG